MKTFTKNQYETIKDNYNAFVANFGTPRIERADYGGGFYVFLPADANSWIQFCYNIDYLNGWLYGCVQAFNRAEFKRANNEHGYKYE